VEHERRLTADAAHELRTPLAAVARRSGRLPNWRRATPTGGRELHAQIGVGIERLTRLVSQLLALAGVESRGAPVFTDAVDWPPASLSWRCPTACRCSMRLGNEVRSTGPTAERRLPITGDEALLVATRCAPGRDTPCRYSPRESMVRCVITPGRNSSSRTGGRRTFRRDSIPRLATGFTGAPGRTQAGGLGWGLSMSSGLPKLHGLDGALRHSPDGVRPARSPSAGGQPPGPARRRRSQCGGRSGSGWEGRVRAGSQASGATLTSLRRA